MSILDLIIVVTMGSFLALGLWKGLIKQVFSYAGLIAGYLASVNYYDEFSRILPPMSEDIAKIISFITIFAVCLVLTSIMGRLIGKAIESAHLSFINRIAGGALGVVKGIVIVLIMLVMLVSFLPADSSSLQNSATLPYILTASDTVSVFFPRSIKDRYRRKVEKIRDDTYPANKKDVSEISH